MLNPSDIPVPVDRSARWATWRTWLFRGIGAIAVIGTGLSFYESFTGLVGWFRLIGFAGDRAVIAPSMIDLVGIVCDVILVVMIVERWDARHKVTFNLAIAGVGYALILSVIGNAGQGGWRLGWVEMSWNAVPPISLAILMTVVLAVVKLWFKPAGEDDAPAIPGEEIGWLIRWPGHVAEGTVPTVAEVRQDRRCGQRKAERIRAYLADAHKALAAADADAAGRSEAAA